MSKFRKFAAVTKDMYLKLSYPHLRHAFSVESHMTLMERVILYELSRNLLHIAEIGSYLGASACCFGATSVRARNAVIICIDTWNNDAMSEGGRDTWLEFRQNTLELSNCIIPVRGYSTEVVGKVHEIAAKLDLLFIDGDHSYDGVKSDWDAYKSFLKSGSIVVFHDYGWAEGVKRVVHENVVPLVSSHDCLPNMWWGTVA